MECSGRERNSGAVGDVVFSCGGEMGSVVVFVIGKVVVDEFVRMGCVEDEVVEVVVMVLVSVVVGCGISCTSHHGCLLYMSRMGSIPIQVSRIAKNSEG